MYTQTYLLSVKHPHLHCTTSAQCAHTIPQVPWCCHAASFTEESLIFFLMDSAVGGRTEIVSIDFIFGRLCSGHLVLQHTLLSLSVFLSHTHHQSLLSHLHASLILVQWLACAILSLFFFFSSDLASFVLCLQCSFMAFPQHIPHSLICPFCFLFIHLLTVFCPSSPVYYFHLIYTVIFLIFFFPCHSLSLPFPHPAYFTQFLSNPSSTLFCFFTCFLPPLSTPPSLTALRFLLPHHFITVFLNPSLVLGLFPTTGFLSPSLSHSREDCQVFHFLVIPTLMIFPPNIVTFS